jgi:hypothetical protein
LKLFDGFNKKAVVIIPTDDVYKERLLFSQKEDSKEIPSILINNMKSKQTWFNFFF